MLTSFALMVQSVNGTETFRLQNPATTSFSASSDGGGGTLVTMTPTVGNMTPAVGNIAELNAAILAADSITTPGVYQIVFANDISLGTTALAAINLQPGVVLDISGDGHALDGGGTQPGLFVYAGTVGIDTLAINNMLARGGNGGSGTLGGGGGGAGLGGGLFVGANANVSVEDVTFATDGAAGGNGGDGGPSRLGDSGGGLDGGAGGGGGGVENGAGGGFGGGGGGGVFGGGGGFGAGGGGGRVPGGGGFGGGGGGLSVGNSSGGGGGGLGAGGDIFVQSGASLTIAGSSLVGRGTVSVGSGGSGATSAGGRGGTAGAYGQAFGSGIFLQGNETLTLGGPTAGATITIAGVIADETGSGGTGSNAGAGSLIINQGQSGTVVLSAVNTYTGGTALESGKLELTAGATAGSGAITFGGPAATLQIDAAVRTFTNTLTNMAVGDQIDLHGLTFDAAQPFPVLPTSTALTVQGANGTETFSLQNPASTSFTASNDGSDGTLVTMTVATTVSNIAELNAAIVNADSITTPGVYQIAFVNDISLGTTALEAINLQPGVVLEMSGNGFALGGAGGLSISSSATVVVSAANTYTGGTTIESGKLELGTALSAGSGPITFSGPALTLQIDAPVSGNQTFTNTLTNMAVGDQIDLHGLTFDAAQPFPVLPTSTALTVQGANGTETFSLQNPASTSFTASNDGSGGTLVSMTAATTVGNIAELNAAIVTADSITTPGVYQIAFANNITLSTTALEGINLKPGVVLEISGSGHSLDGGGTQRGLFVYAGTVDIVSLAINNMLAQGGNGGGGLSAGGGGGGAGLGGGLFVGANVNGDPGNVTLKNVTFANDSAAGGNGGAGSSQGSGGGGGGGGGGLGGNGGFGSGGGGGGGGIGGFGGTGTGVAGGAGLIPGGAAGGAGSGPNGGGSRVGGSGGPSGGGGGGAILGGDAAGGGGGGVGGATGTIGIFGGRGGFGGGGGGSSAGFFQGAGGGPGGFGGGGGGGAFARSGGFGGGAGGHTRAGFRGVAGFGGGSSGLGGGGGGLGAGGDIFVQGGASLTIVGTSMVGAGTITGGTGAPGGGNGQAFANGIYLQGNNTLTFNPTGTQTVGGVIGDDKGSAAAASYAGVSGFPGYTEGSVGIVVNGTGTLQLIANNTYTGGTTIESGKLELTAGATAGSGARSPSAARPRRCRSTRPSAGIRPSPTP